MAARFNTENTANFRIAIVGGGTAGLSLACCLKDLFE